MRYGSVCSGIEAVTVAWHPLGWEAAWHSEIEPFPCAVLKHHYPAVPNYGDMTKYEEWPDEPINLLVGGTPCQSFSVAGLRKGLADPRGNLMLTYGAIARRYRPEWLVWENVPGVLSSNGGRDFGTFLGMLAELGYGFAYRVLDAQWFGVAQRRRRVFVVANARSWQRAAAVLFESHSLQGHPAPRREARQETAASAAAGVDERGLQLTVGTLCADTHPGAYSGQDAYTGRLVPQTDVDLVQTLQATNPMTVAFAQNQLGEVRTSTIAGTINTNSNASGRNTPMVAQPVAMRESGQGYWMQDTVSGTLRAEGENRPSRPSNVIAQPINFYGGNKREDRPEGGFYVKAEETSKTLDAASGLNPTCSQGGTAVMTAMQVRRLTPVECERLQGFPDGYTNIPWRKATESPDGPRYKALGNSMAVPVMAWIGKRIKQVSEL